MAHTGDKFDRAGFDDLDRALDGVTSRYTAVEPRAGLEERILATLRAEQSTASGRTWWKLTLAAAVTAVVVAGLALAWKSGKRVAPEIVKRPVLTAGPEALIQTAKRADSSREPENPRIRRAALKQSKSLAVTTEDPKLDQFPSPEPLTEEERALIRYVSQFPGEAVTIARAQEDFEKEIRQQTHATPDRVSSDSQRQER